jgi:dienelactone hydrolase
MKRHSVSTARITGTSIVALLAIPGIVTITRAQLSTGKPPAESIPPHGYVIASKPLKGTDTPADYTFVLTRDELYVPIIVRKPKGNGPFPAVTMGWGEGREGMKKAERLAESLTQMQDRMIARGYVVATVNYRNEVPYAYEQSKPPQNLPDSISGERRMLKSGPTLDHEDLIAIIRYLQSLPYVDKNGVGAMGVSHSGEMIMKASSEYTFGAGVCIEPADHEFLTVDNDAEVVRKNANKAEAMERIRRISTPILIFGRDTDHLQGIFKLTYEWMKEAGKDVQWASFDHPTHGYVFIMNQPDGSYKPDEIQQKAFAIFMNYFDQHLKHAR